MQGKETVSTTLEAALPAELPLVQRMSDGKHVIVERSELHSILSGIELATVKKRIRYVPPVVPNA